ncbi:hypothetical protein BJ170DRAFT_33345 [Xylariales sp. AK1849]|nr:hypothetical protein BJ170DRAFT_33345 [Xylariales sp. AK1849]
MDASTSTPLLRISQLLGLSTSLFLSGIFYAHSRHTVPLLYNLDHERVSPGVFAQLYYSGARTVIPLAVVSALASGFVASQNTGNDQLVWAGAALAPLAALAFTRIVMMPTIQTLLRAAGEGKGQSSEKSEVATLDGEEVVRLLKRWKKMNWARSWLSLMGGLIGAWAVVSKA